MAGFTNIITGEPYVSLNDQHNLVKINEKEVVVGDIGVIVQGEISSQKIEFSIPKFYDGVDLTDKDFYVLFKTKGGMFKINTVDKAASNDTDDDGVDEIRFSWVLDENATMYAGDVTACVQIEKTYNDDPNKKYVMKTKMFKIKVEESLNEYDAEGVYASWATQVESKISELEHAAAASEAMFVGTNDEYNTASANGEIPNGMFVTITDQ